MGSKTFDGVWFLCWSLDHPPAHVHGRYAETQVILDLLPDGSIRPSSREDAVQPKNAKRSDVRRIVKIANEYASELHKLWEDTHG